MYRFKHIAISNVCEASPTRPGFVLPAVVRMTFTKVHSPILACFASSQPVRCDIAAKLVGNKTLFCHSERM